MVHDQIYQKGTFYFFYIQADFLSKEERTNLNND